MTFMLVASDGGHLAQLVELEKRIAGKDCDRLWVTFDSPQSRSLLAGRETRYIPRIDERDVAGVCRGIIEARKIFSGGTIEAVISTGSAIALPFLLHAAVRGIPGHYIESAARVSEPSLTGRVLEWVPGLKLYRQYPAASHGRWQYGGSVFDGFTAAVGVKKSVHRIVVTLGSGDHAFRRLVDRLVKILPRSAQVVWQTGCTPVSDLNIDAHSMLPSAVLDQAIAEADVVIGHAGCGTALSALNAGKFAILVPREMQYGELVDTHQVEIAKWLEERNLVFHRNPNSISMDDIYMAAERRVCRSNTPPAFRLA